MLVPEVIVLVCCIAYFHFHFAFIPLELFFIHFIQSDPSLIVKNSGYSKKIISCISVIDKYYF